MASMTIASFTPIFSGLQFEFDESEEWDSSTTATNDEVAVSETTRWSMVLPNDVCHMKTAAVKGESSVVDQVSVTAVTAAKSLPMKIPDWRRILGVAYQDNRADDDDDDEYFKLPPHEYLARTRGASLSGRSLKGRDLWRLRNAIWKRIGFED